MTWTDTLTSLPVLLLAALGLAAGVIYLKSTGPPEKPTVFTTAEFPAGRRRSSFAQAVHAASDAGHKPTKSTMPSVMSAPAAELAPPKSDPITVATLRQHDGSDPTKPIYVAIKGNVYDVSAKKDMYGPGKGYNVFAGRDASCGLGKSSLEPRDAKADYSGLDEKEMQTLNQWESFFQKRYNIVGKVVP